jgi:hypothetical protein
VILPFVVLRRLDLVLEPQKDAVIKQFEQFKGSLDEERLTPILRQAAGGTNFYNHSFYDLRRLSQYSKNIELNFNNYVPGFGDRSLYNTEDEKDLLSHIITTLNETYGLNLTEEDKVDMQHIRTRLKADEGLKAVLNADNPRDAKVYKFNQVLDRLLRREGEKRLAVAVKDSLSHIL